MSLTTFVKLRILGYIPYYWTTCVKCCLSFKHCRRHVQYSVLDMSVAYVWLARFKIKFHSLTAHILNRFIINTAVFMVVYLAYMYLKPTRKLVILRQCNSTDYFDFLDVIFPFSFVASFLWIRWSETFWGTMQTCSAYTWLTQSERMGNRSDLQMRQRMMNQL